MKTTEIPIKETQKFLSSNKPTREAIKETNKGK
jgi:hypothetical protein